MHIVEIYKTLNSIEIEDVVSKLWKRSIVTYRLAAFNYQHALNTSRTVNPRLRSIKAIDTKIQEKTLTGTIERGFKTQFSLAGYDLNINENTLIVGELFQGVDAKVKLKGNRCISIIITTLTISL